jgi:hypothetical protein
MKEGGRVRRAAVSFAVLMAAAALWRVFGSGAEESPAADPLAGTPRGDGPSEGLPGAGRSWGQPAPIGGGLKPPEEVLANEPLADRAASSDGGRAAAEAGEQATVWPATADGIVGAIKEAQAGMQRCYEVALEEVPGLSGRLALRFVLGEEDGVGRILEVGITDDEVQDGPLEECVLDVVQALEFDPPEGGKLTVKYPLVFEAGD